MDSGADDLNRPVIRKIKVETSSDDSPDLSYLGEFHNRWEDGCVDLEEINDGARIGGCLYFKPPEPFDRLVKDLEKHYANREEAVKEANRIVIQNAERLASFGTTWEMLGIEAKAEVGYAEGNGCTRITRFESGGLWGIESDSDESFLKEIKQEQIADLKSHLGKFNVDLSNFDELAAKALEDSR